MAKYEIEISFTREGEEHSLHGAVEAASYLQALAAVSAKFGEELEQEGIDSSGGITVKVWGLDTSQGTTEVDDMPAGV